MAAGAVIGALRVNLGLDSAQFQSGLKRSQSGLDKFAKAAAVGFAAAAAAATGAFMAIQGAANRADQQMKASQSFGVPIEQLGRLSHAAELSGSSMQEVGKAAQRASRAVNDAMNGVSNAGTRAFEQLGVALTATDGTARDIESILGDVAEQFANMPDGAQKTALAIEMFGRSGANLIPMLNQGRDGLKEMGDEAERLGLVFDEQTARASERFNDNLLRLNRTMTGLWNQVLSNVIAGFSQLTDRIIAATQAGGGLDMIVQGVSFAMNGLVRVIILVIDNMDALINVFKVWMALNVASVVVNATRAFIALGRAIRTAGTAKAFFTKISRLNVIVIGTLAAVLAQATGQLEPFIGAVERASSALYNALPEDMRTGIDDLISDFGNLGFQFDNIESSLSGVNTALPEIQSGLGGAGNAARGAASGIDTASQAMQNMAQIGQQVTNSLASGFADMFASAIDGSKSLIQSIGDLLNQLGRMLLNQGFQMLIGALFGGGTGGIGSFFSGLFGGFRAKGGPVSAGKSYVVGERGPELFMPGANGNIVPNNALGQASGNVQVTIGVEASEYFDARVQNISAKGDAQVIKTVERQVPSIMANAQLRGA